MHYLVFKEPPPFGGQPDYRNCGRAVKPRLAFSVDRTRLGGKFEACLDPNRTTRRVEILGDKLPRVKPFGL